MDSIDADKVILLAYLTTKQREEALKYISKRHNTTPEESEKLLKAFELEFDKIIHEPPAKNFDAATCAGCLSGVLKVVAVLMALFGVALFGIGYFITDLFGDRWNNRMVPVVVSGYIYSRPDSSYVNIIYQYQDGTELKSDTSTIEYDLGFNSVGDTLHVVASDLDIALDEEVKQKLTETQEAVYIGGGVALFFALVFWLVGSRIKIYASKNSTS